VEAGGRPSVVDEGGGLGRSRTLVGWHRRLCGGGGSCAGCAWTVNLKRGKRENEGKKWRLQQKFA
jgi:hypothetical protein